VVNPRLVTAFSAAMLPVWIALGVSLSLAVYSLLGIIHGSEWMDRRIDQWERSPKFMQWLYAIFSFGQWRKRRVMKAWSLQGAIGCFTISLGAVGLMIFFLVARPGMR